MKQIRWSPVTVLLTAAKDVLIVSVCVVCLVQAYRLGRPTETTCEIPKAYDVEMFKVMATDMAATGFFPGRAFRSRLMLYPSLEEYERENGLQTIKGAEQVRRRPVVILEYWRRKPLPEGTFGLTSLTYFFDAAAATNFCRTVVE